MNDNVNRVAGFGLRAIPAVSRAKDAGSDVSGAALQSLLRSPWRT